MEVLWVFYVRLYTRFNRIAVFNVLCKLDMHMQRRLYFIFPSTVPTNSNITINPPRKEITIKHVEIASCNVNLNVVVVVSVQLPDVPLTMYLFRVNILTMPKKTHKPPGNHYAGHF